MKFEWDKEKDRANIRKHGVSFERAKSIFNGPVWSRLDDREEYGETRIVSVGMMDNTVLVVVVHTDRRRTIRIISARFANRWERKRYYEELRRAFDDSIFGGDE
jgi:uncharacterized DUF497 family protein